MINKKSYMKYLPILFALYSCSLLSQEVISETSTANKVDSNYYLQTVKVVSNDSPIPDTLTEKIYLGDSITARNYIIRDVSDYNDRSARLFQKLVSHFRSSEIAKMNQAYTDITGTNIYQGLADRFNSRFEGVFRVLDGSADWIGDAETNINGVLRMKSRSTADNLVIRPLSNHSFLVTNWPGGARTFYDSGILLAGGRRLFVSANWVAGDGQARIVFIRPKGQ